MGEQVLTKVDRASMAHSLEVRVPFLDHELVELLWSFDPAVTFRPGAQKPLLRANLEGRLPEAIVQRTKQGFVGPDAYYQNVAWYRGLLATPGWCATASSSRRWPPSLAEADHWRLRSRCSSSGTGVADMSHEECSSSSSAAARCTSKHSTSRCTTCGDSGQPDRRGDRRRRAAGRARPRRLSDSEALSDAQAAIWLKTSLHRVLDPRHRYCYLDTDVLAARAGVDQVFMYRFGPVTFATDHCRMRYFSPWAVECGCLSDRRLAQAAALNALIEPLDACPPALADKRRRLQAKLEAYSARYRSPGPELALRRETVRRLLERTAGQPLERRAALLAFVLPKYGARLTRRLWRGGEPAEAANAVIDDALGTLPEFIRRELGFDWRLDERRGYDEAGRLLSPTCRSTSRSRASSADEARRVGRWRR
jgi:hypothetical protein